MNVSRSDVAVGVRDEAITWFARLRADDFSERDRVQFILWLGESADHQHAFSEIIGLWEGLPGLRQGEIEEEVRLPRRRPVELAR